MDHSLEGKRVMVTAAAAGIGRTIAEAFLRAGAQVHFCDLDADKLAAFEQTSSRLRGTRADVADPVQVDRVFDEALQRWDALDVLVNNAGIAGPVGPVESLDTEDWRHTIAVNLDGMFFGARRAVPLLKKAGGGSIVNIASTAGLCGYPYRAPYVASKWAVVGLSKTLAKELGEFNIRVNAICPGSVEGDRIQRVIDAEAELRGVGADQVRQDYLRQASLRTFIDTEDIANMVLFVCSDLGAKISGQALTVDGDTDSTITR